MPFATKTKNTTLSYVRGVLSFASDIYGFEDNSKLLKNFKKTDVEILEEMEVWTV